MRLFSRLLFLSLLTLEARAAISDGDRGFAQLKALAGTWTAAQDGQNMPVTFELVANDTTIVQKSGFLLVLHRDGDAIRATVFTDDDNQPRFRSKGIPEHSKTMQFEFVDATNVKPGAAMATGLQMDFQTPDVVVERWIFKENGKESSLTFTIRRVKAMPVRH